MSAKGPNYLTVRGRNQLAAELKHLQTVERPRVVHEVSEAAAQGDRSENAEYIYGKKRLREIDRRLRYLTRTLEGATIVDPREQSGERIFFGATVTLEDEEGETQVMQIVGVDEIAPSEGRISWRSPIGAALLGKSVDDEVRIATPGGARTLFVLAVAYEA